MNNIKECQFLKIHNLETKENTLPPPGGRSSPRVAFESFTKDSQRIAIYVEGKSPKPFLLPLRYIQLKVSDNDTQKTIWVNKNSLVKRLNVKNIGEALNVISHKQKKASDPVQATFVPRAPNIPGSRPKLKIGDEEYILLTKCRRLNDHLIGKGTVKKAKEVISFSSCKEDLAVLTIARKSNDSEESWAEQCQEIEREIETMKKFQGPNFLRLSGYCKRDGNSYREQKYYLLVERCDPLDKSLGKIGNSEEAKDRVSREIVSAVASLHKAGYLHRDIKLGNMLLTTDLHAKVSDLGSACKANDREALLDCRLTYPSPEQAKHLGWEKRTEFAKNTTVKSDSWALGLALYSIHNTSIGLSLIQGKSLGDKAFQTNCITDKAMESCLLQSIPNEKYRGIIRDLLRVNPDDRIDAVTALERLSEDRTSSLLHHQEASAFQIPKKCEEEDVINPILEKSPILPPLPEGEGVFEEIEL